MNELADSIEAYLIAQRTWVKAAEICSRFEVTERQLRAVGDRPGLCSEYAISGDKGFKHVQYATTAEYLRFKHRLRRHGIAELIRVRKLDQRRSNVTRTIRKTFTFEADTGQGMLFQ